MGIRLFIFFIKMLLITKYLHDFYQFINVYL